jgi:cysteine desulfurase/selenocysteine lyase
MYNTRGDIDALAEALWNLSGKARPKPAPQAGTSSNGGADQVQYPQAAGATPQAAADALAEDFDLLGERDAKNEYVLDLGNKLPPLFDLLKKVTPRVQGCMSEVYLVGRRSPQDATRLEFVADADAHIVRGLIAILERIYSGQKAADVLAFDIESFFRRIGLDQFITTQRRNGLAGMVQRIHLLAQEVAGAPSGT